MLKQTALHALHQQARATFFSFAGWEMPLHYGSQLEEHHAVRHHAGMFDVSHMRVIDIRGTEAPKFLRYVLANDPGKMSAGKALYSCMLNHEGGILDDLIVYAVQPDHYRLVVNAATGDKDFGWLQDNTTSFNIDVNMPNDLAIIALQGPAALDRLQSVFSFEQWEILKQLKRFGCVVWGKWLIARTGYTGEDGFEIILPQHDAPHFWNACLKSGFRPIGLGARDSLRLEAGFNLYGQDMDESVTPFESNLAWTIDWRDPAREFIGKAALQHRQQQGIKQQLVGLVLLTKGICRAGMDVLLDENHSGKMTSGGYAPTLEKSIGLARIPVGDFANVQVKLRHQLAQAKIMQPPFVKNGTATFSV